MQSESARREGVREGEGGVRYGECTRKCARRARGRGGNV